LYWLTDGAYGTIFLVYSKGVIAVDPLPTLGPRYLQAISEVTDRPVTHVVYSHEHTDHIGAADLFPRNAIFIAQKETASILARRKDPRRPVPKVTFDKKYTLRAGEQTLVLEYKGVNHALGNIFIHAPRQRVLMLVDVVYPGFMPYKNLGIAEDVQGYIRAHAEALTYDFDVFVGGHVSRLGTRKDVQVATEFVNECGPLPTRFWVHWIFRRTSRPIRRMTNGICTTSTKKSALRSATRSCYRDGMRGWRIQRHTSGITAGR
jgi:glyoxylase-like metal-dependent hydrolase (beta-lactamase superfamily II)